MSKSAFSEESIKNILSSDTTLNEGFMNDIYSQHNAHTKPENNIIATNVIKPATEKHIQKYSQQNMFLMNETSEDYTNITLPFIEKQQFSIEVRDNFSSIVLNRIHNFVSCVENKLIQKIQILFWGKDLIITFKNNI